MGATTKKIHQGKRSRRAVPEPRIPEVPDNHFDSMRVICWECWNSFSVKDVEGGYLKRRCPRCGAALSEDGCDAAAKEVNTAYRKASSRVRELSSAQTRLTAWIEQHPQWWFYLHRYVRQRKRQKIDSELKQVKHEEYLAKKRLSNYEHARYHLGEWYLNTHIPLVVADGPKDFTYRLGAVYQDTNEFALEYRRGMYGRGVAAEFAVFEAFRREVVRPESALYGAILAPNIYLPIAAESHDISALWSQIDLVILTKSCVFIVEVKGRYADIVADRSFCSILSNKPGKAASATTDNNDLIPYNKPLAQNEGHAFRFQELFDRYDPERVYRAVVFANVRSFSCDGASFVNNTFVGCVPNCEETLIKAFCEACDQNEPILTQEQLEQFGEDLILNYGDLNQKRHWLHVNRIRNMR